MNAQFLPQTAGSLNQVVPVSPSSPISDQSLNIKLLLTASLSGKSERTIKAYQGDIRDFSNFSGAENGIVALQKLLENGAANANVMGLVYQQDMIERKLSSSTINRRLAALRSVVKMGRILGMVNWSLEVGNLSHESYRDTQGCGTDGFIRLLQAAGRQSMKRAKRDTAILWLLFNPALRRSEVASLMIGDVDFERKTIKVIAKGKREKELISLSDPALAALSEWTQVRGDHNGALFVNFDRSNKTGEDKGLTADGIYYIVRYLGKKAGVKTRPHGLRHSGITQASTSTNGNAPAIQSFSRHVDIRTVMKYIDNAEDVAGQVSELIADEVISRL